MSAIPPAAPSPWWTSDNGETRVRLYHGHVLDVLRRLPAESVHTVITSPPYYHQRDFGLPPQLWGGNPSCAHAWDRPRVGRRGTTCTRCGGWLGQLGLEPTADAYLAHMVEIFREVRRVLHRAGTLWLNLADSYTDKQLLGIPWRLALALQSDGWVLRVEIVWAKALSFCPTYSGSALPEDADDRPVRGHETVFLLAREPRYFYDRDAVREPHNDLANGDRFQGRAGLSHAEYDAQKWSTRSDGIARPPITMRTREYHPFGRPLRSVWAVNPQPFTDGQHLATFAEALVVPMVLAGTSERGCCPRCGAPWRRSPEGWQAGCRHEHAPVPCTALDPFAGAGTALLVSQRLGRNAIGIELSPTYLELARKRIAAEHGQMRLFGTPGGVRLAGTAPAGVGCATPGGAGMVPGQLRLLVDD
jgi:DNA modification methylase